MPTRKLLPFLALLFVGCKGCTSVPTTTNTEVAPTPAAETGGLKGRELIRWHHLAEGSEVYPLSWIQALQNQKTGHPFLANPERFGLLPDPIKSDENPYGLPV